MNYSKYRFTLDMQSSISQVSLPVRQHDTGIVLRINLSDGGMPFKIENGSRAVFCGLKADDNTITNDCIIEKNTTICYELSPQTTAYSGIVDCEIRLYDADGHLITSPKFILVVDSRVIHDEDFPLSESEQSILDQIVIEEQGRVQRAKHYEEVFKAINDSVKVWETNAPSMAAGKASLFPQGVDENGKNKYKSEIVVDFEPTVIIRDAISNDKHLVIEFPEAIANEDGIYTIVLSHASDSNTPPSPYNFIVLGRGAGGAEALVSFTIIKEDGTYSNYTVISGTTWKEWADASYSVEYGAFEWDCTDNAVVNNFSSHVLCYNETGDFEYVNPTDTPVIVSGTYYMRY